MKDKQTKLKVGDTVRVVNQEWAKGIGNFRASIRSLEWTGKDAFRSQVAVLAWKGKSHKDLNERFGNKFHTEDLRKA